MAAVIHAERGDAGLQRRHRVAARRQAFEQIEQLIREFAMPAKIGIEVGQLFLCRELAAEQEPGGFLEAAFAGQCFDGDAAIFQSRPLAIDKADRRLGGRHVGQSRPQLHGAHAVSVERALHGG